jgi:hypothetical protein
MKRGLGDENKYFFLTHGFKNKRENCYSQQIILLLNYLYISLFSAAYREKKQSFEMILKDSVLPCD